MKSLMKSLKSVILKRIERMLKLYSFISSNRRSLRPLLILVVVTAISFTICGLLPLFFEEEFPVTLVAGIKISASVVILALRIAIVSIFGFVMFTNFSFRKASLDWDRTLPSPVALLVGVMTSRWIAGIYHGSSAFFVVFVGSASGSRLFAFALLLLWEYFLFFQLVLYSTECPEWNIPSLYASYISSRARNVLLAVSIAILGYEFCDLVRSSLEDWVVSKRLETISERNTQREIGKEDHKLKLEILKLENNRLILENNRILLETAKRKSWWPFLLSIVFCPRGVAQW